MIITAIAHIVKIMYFKLIAIAGISALAGTAIAAIIWIRGKKE